MALICALFSIAILIKISYYYICCFFPFLFTNQIALEETKTTTKLLSDLPFEKMRDDEALLYIEQELTEAQKAQARTNIGAAAPSEITSQVTTLSNQLYDKNYDEVYDDYMDLLKICFPLANKTKNNVEI
mgnify:CR=1 FL=1